MIFTKNIINNKNLPPFIRENKIFTLGEKFEKIFPYIGLSNFEHNIMDAKGQLSFIFSNSSFASKVTDHYASTADPEWLKYTYNIISPILFGIVFSKYNYEWIKFKFKNRKLKLVFSSDAWDIATMSMRGINSCQAWFKPRANKLIGSIIDPCCAIIYITNGDKSKYGTEMLHRAIVRYVIHDTLGPCLFLEQTYSQSFKDYEKDIIEFLFASVLKQKTGLPVIYKPLLLGEHSHHVIKHLSIPETVLIKNNDRYASYRDSGIHYRPLKNRLPSIIEERFSNIFTRIKS